MHQLPQRKLAYVPWEILRRIAAGILCRAVVRSSHDRYSLGFPPNECCTDAGDARGLRWFSGNSVDASGDVFIANQQAQDLLEYAHGGTRPIAKLDDPGNYRTGCSVDPSSGNLAAVNGGESAGISIYQHAHGAPTIYTDRSVWLYFCGYDDKGNLFADGLGLTGGFKFVELPHGGNAFIKIALDQKLHWPGGVQWDGQYLTAGDQGLFGKNSVIYQFVIDGNRGTTVGSTPLLGSFEVAQFWIDGSRIIGPDSGRESGNGVRIWRYPTGGHPRRSLIDGFGGPVGAAISKEVSNGRDASR